MTLMNAFVIVRFVIVRFVIVRLTLLSIACASGLVSIASGIFFVIVLAGRAAVARRIFVCEDSGDFVIKVFIRFKVILRNVFTIFVSQDKARELQLISVIERILCAEVVFDAVVSDVIFVCVHVILFPSIQRSVMVLPS